MNLQENINQVNSDFQKIKSAIVESGIPVEDGTPTSELGEKIGEVYEAGKRAEYDKFWDKIQNNGNTANYYYAFCYNRLNDEVYNPKYPIRCADETTHAQAIFYSNSQITDTKVEIIVNGSSANNCFYQMSNCHTIRKFTVTETTSFNNTFASCSSLVNIEIGGTIGKSISFGSCKLLSDESVDSIIEHLKDRTDLTSQTLTVHENVYNRMVELGKDILVTAKNWTLAKA